MHKQSVSTHIFCEFSSAFGISRVTDWCQWIVELFAFDLELTFVRTLLYVLWYLTLRNQSEFCDWLLIIVTVVVCISKREPCHFHMNSMHRILTNCVLWDRIWNLLRFQPLTYGVYSLHVNWLMSTNRLVYLKPFCFTPLFVCLVSSNAHYVCKTRAYIWIPNRESSKSAYVWVSLCWPFGYGVILVGILNIWWRFLEFEKISASRNPNRKQISIIFSSPEGFKSAWIIF